MPNRSLPDHFHFQEPRVQIALRAALSIAVIAILGFVALGHRTIAQRDVASYLARAGCIVGYDPVRAVDDASGNERELGLHFHARHSLVSVTIHSLEQADELVEQLRRVDTVKNIRIEYASSGGCLFTVAPELAAIEKIKTTFPNATVEVKITLIAVVG
jgi:hypothetical protein